MDLIGTILADQHGTMSATIQAFRDACVEIQHQLMKICEEHLSEYSINTVICADSRTNTGILPQSTPEEIHRVNGAILDLAVRHALVQKIYGVIEKHRGLAPIIELCNSVLTKKDYIATVYVFLALVHKFKFIYTHMAQYTPGAVMELYFPSAPVCPTDPPPFCTRFITTFQGSSDKDALHPISGVLQELSVLATANKIYYSSC